MGHSDNLVRGSSGNNLLIELLLVQLLPRRLRALMTDSVTSGRKGQTLTEASELPDDVGQADVGDTFQLTADVGGDSLAT